MLTEIQKSIITGCVLGTSGLDKNRLYKKYRFRIEKSIESLEYVEWVFEHLQNNCKSGLNFRSQAPCCNKINHLVGFATSLKDEDITVLGNFLYNDGKKIIPNDLKLNKFIIAAWFGDSGEVIQTSKNNIKVLFNRLNRQNLLKREIKQLSELLSEYYGEKFVITNSSYQNKSKNYYIYGRNQAAVKLLKDIDDVILGFSKDRKQWLKYIS